MLMNILYLADPNSTHDLKWITWFAPINKIFIIRREIHDPPSGKSKDDITDTGAICDVSIFSPLKVLNSLRKLKSIIRSKDIELIHIHFAEPNILWAIFRRFLGVPIVVTTRGSDILITISRHFELFSVQNIYVRQLYKLAFRNCDKIICTSSSQLNSINRFFKPKNEISVIRTGIDIEDLSNPTALNLPTELKEHNYVLMPRIMRPIYMHELTIKAIGLLDKSIKEEYIFVFLDCNSKEVEYVTRIKYLMNLDPDTSFCFLPRQTREELQTLYLHSSLVIMHPETDGSPVSAMEAMLFEKPLIIGPAKYDSDLFGEWVSKMTSWNPDDLADLIIDSLKNVDQHKIMVAKSKVIELGNRSTEMQKLNEIYKSLLTSSAHFS